MKRAAYFISSGNLNLECALCPHNCKLNDGQEGICHVRKNIGGILYSLNHGIISALNLDPIEKKPLYHYYPGGKILSVGSVGCNLQCSFCQNCTISQWKGKSFAGLNEMEPDQLVELASNKMNNIGIAYTYNEPTVFVEFMLEAASIAKGKNLRNIMVSNGYISEQPLSDLLRVIDAFNIDLKGFNDVFYKKVTKANLAPVLNTLVKIRESGRHLEITNLVIPELNDDPADFKAMVKWISGQLGPSTILHLSRYFPHHRLNTPPTSKNSLLSLYEIAKEHLHFVYLGNVDFGEGQSTICPTCKSLVIERVGYSVSLPGLNAQGHCKTCHEMIAVC